VKIYVASSWRNPDQPLVVGVLRRQGHQVYDFRQPHLGPGKRSKGFHWSEIDPDWQSWTPAQFRRALQHPTAVDGFSSDMVGLDWCDACVLAMPCGRSAHLELGYARGAGKFTIILLAKSEPELMYGMVDSICTTPEEMIEAIRAEGARLKLVLG
jgi:hypothetical protein